MRNRVNVWWLQIIVTFMFIGVALIYSSRAEAAPLLSDDFNPTTTESNPFWRFYDPYSGVTGQSTLTFDDTNALIEIPAGLSHDLWVGSANRAPRLLQPADNEDFGIEAKFESTPAAKYQMQGIIVQQADDIFLRFDVYYDGASPRLFAAYINGANGIVYTNAALSSTPRYRRVIRSGNQWTYRYSSDGATWIDAITFTQVLTVTEVGVFGGTNTPNPAFLVSIDYFMNLAAPIVDNDVWVPPPSPPPSIDVWYGNTKTFGQLGNPQKWINVLGNVSPSVGVDSLTYSLNGSSPDQALAIGPDGFRLVEPGDFNIEIDQASLINGANTVEINAMDSAGIVTTEMVTINYTPGNVWPLPYTANWGAAPNIQGVEQIAQIVDGFWELTPGGIRTVQFGYDRTIAVGDETWLTDYEVTVPITTHSGFDGMGVAIGWQGHEGTQSPKIEWPLQAIAWLRGTPPPSSLQIMTYGGLPPSSWEVIRASQPVVVTANVTYMLKTRSEFLGGGMSRVFVKFWPQNNAEPTQWNINADVPTRDGSVLLVAYNADVTFGNVEITPISTPPPTIPTITTQPASQTVTAGQTATFSVTATGSAPLSYQWQKNGVNVTGATSASYTTPATTSADNGATFRCIVSNSVGSTTSNSATLTVTAGASAPTITTQPASQTVTAGQTATFSVTATGSAPLSYQWQKNGVNVTGATSASYTTPATTSADNGATFRCIVSNSVGGTTSNSATLTVTAGASAPTITTQPASQTVTAGQTATFSVTATGSAPLSYQWQKNGVNVTGATSASYTTPATTSADNGATFRCIVSNSVGSTTSNSATLTVTAGTASILSDDFNPTTTEPNPSWRFYDPYSGVTGQSTLTYNGTNALIAIPAGLSHDLWVGSANLAPRLLQPAPNGDFGIEAKFESTPSARYQMQGIIVQQANNIFLRFDVYHDGVSPRLFAASINGANGTVYTDAALSSTPLYRRVIRSGNQWTYRYSSNGTTWTDAITFTQALTVTEVGVFGGTHTPNPAFTGNTDYFMNLAAPIVDTDSPSQSTAPTITTQPASQTVTAGQTATFSVTATGSAPLSYQWQKNGVNVTGATSASYTTPATTSADNGATFRCIVSNSVGSTTSNSATLTVTAGASAPTITTQPASQTVTAGQTATFSVTATGSAPLSYQWQKNGVNVTGATSASYTTPATTSADNGATFRCIVSNSVGGTTSNSATLTVTAGASAPTITTQPASQTVTAGQTATFSVTATGSAPLSYQWQKNGVNVTGATSASYTTPATTSADNGATFRCIVSNSVGSTTSNSATLTVTAGTASILSDDFNPTTTEPNPSWRFYDPYSGVTGQSTLTYNGTNALIAIPAGLSHDLWVGSANLAPRLLQPAPNGDFGIEAKFESTPSARYQMQGIIVQQANNIFLRFDVYHDGVSPRLFAASINGANGTVYTDAALSSTPLYRRVIRSGNQWTYRYSSNGTTWTDAITFTQALTVTEVGVFGGTHTPNPAFTGNTDYFMNLAAPIVDTDSPSQSTAPTITTQPASQTVTAGQTATFSVTATGSAPLSYQWQKNGVNVTGATSASYTTPATTSADNGATFRCIVSNSVGSTTSNSATLTVTAGASAPTITTQPASQTVTAGQTATFSVTATGSAPLSYQWQKNGVNVTGATSASYTTPATTSADNGATFRCIVSNSVGGTTSNSATLTVTAGASAPTITTQPASQTVTAGQTATFSVTATGSAPLSYQWQKNGVNVTGATSASYTTPATTSADNGATFRCIVSNSVGGTTSNSATLTVTAGTASILSDDFNPTTTEPNPSWRFYDPYSGVTGQSTLTYNGTNALIAIPAGLSHDLWVGSANLAPRLLQPAPNGDFGIEAKFESTPSARYQMQGIIVQQANNIFLRFDVYHDGVSPRLFAASINGANGTVYTDAALSSTPLYRRVIRSGNQWTYRYSSNGTTWTDAITFTQALTVTEVGVFGGTHTPNPAFTGNTDYFMNLAAPLVDND